MAVICPILDAAPLWNKDLRQGIPEAFTCSNPTRADFSNGLTFGIMYVALIGDANKRHWAWGVVFTVGLELAMLFTPYPAFFGIALTAKFVAVTMVAHQVFGHVMGLAAQRLWRLFTTHCA